jgi:hypothetical protein
MGRRRKKFKCRYKENIYQIVMVTLCLVTGDRQMSELTDPFVSPCTLSHNARVKPNDVGTIGLLQTCETFVFWCFFCICAIQQKYPFIAWNMVAFLIITTVYSS